jgi:hypothetical protein
VGRCKWEGECKEKNGRKVCETGWRGGEKIGETKGLLRMK